MPLAHVREVAKQAKIVIFISKNFNIYSIDGAAGGSKVYIPLPLREKPKFGSHNSIYAKHEKPNIRQTSL